jgi:hypothetical protein
MGTITKLEKKKNPANITLFSFFYLVSDLNSFSFSSTLFLSFLFLIVAKTTILPLFTQNHKQQCLEESILQTICKLLLLTRTKIKPGN